MTGSSSPAKPSTSVSSSTTEAAGERRSLLLLAWRGQGYVGWQRQPEGVSVQQRVEEAASVICGGASVRAMAAGRTDAGVHAWAQVVRVAHAVDRSPEAFFRGLGARLPPDIACLAAAEAPPDFHPVRDAVAKHYRYRILRREARCAFREGSVWRLARPLDLSAMRAAAAALVGHHDFSAFRATGCTAPDAHKTVTHLDLTERGDELHVDVFGDGFLRHQVRIMVGSLVEVGMGRMSPAALSAALVAKDRGAAGPTAPPSGLWLVGVKTQPVIDWAAGGPPLGAPGDV